MSADSLLSRSESVRRYGDDLTVWSVSPVRTWRGEARVFVNTETVSQQSTFQVNFEEMCTFVCENRRC